MTETAVRRRHINPGFVKIAAAALIWGSMGILIRLLDLSPIVIVFWRALFALVAIGIFILGTGGMRDFAVTKYRLLLPMTGVALTFSMGFFARAVELTTVANAVLVTYTAPVIIALLAPLFLKERFERKTLVALALAVAGIILILAPQGLTLGGRHATGIGFAFLTAVAYAGLVIVGKRVVEHVRARTVTFYESLTSVVILLPLVVRAPVPSGVRNWTMLVVLGLVHSALAGMLYMSGLRTVKAQEAGILAYLEPLSAGIYGLIFLGEPLTGWVLAGGALILGAGWVVMRVRPPEAAPLPK